MNRDWYKDYYRMTGVEYKFGLCALKRVVCSHQIRYMMLWRKCNNRAKIFNKYLLFRYAKKYGLEISTSAQIGKGLYLGHPYNITVSGEAIIGKNVNLHKGCTIGRENRGKRIGAPKIGDNVSVGINATVVGNVRIGNDVMIAPNSFVNFDVPDHSVVIGNPGEIHQREEATKGYVCFRV